MENWRSYTLNEEEDPRSITTIGELHNYFEAKNPGLLKKFVAKYGGISAKVLGVVAGAATGGAGGVVGTGAGVIAEKVVEQLLMASIMAFANIEDGTYQEGTAASYFDLDDNLTIFLRDLETKGSDVVSPSKPEMETFKKLKKIIKDKVTADVSPDTRISAILQDITSQAVLDKDIRSGEYSGKVAINYQTS